MGVLRLVLIAFAFLMVLVLFRVFRGITEQEATGLGAVHPLIRPFAERFLRRMFALRGICS
jgi:hypothetical protein